METRIAEMKYTASEHEAVLSFINPGAGKRTDHFTYKDKYNLRPMSTVVAKTHAGIPKSNFVISLGDGDKNAGLSKIDGDESDSAMISMLHRAFGQHIPVALRPDEFHILILQGITQFINQYPEDFRATLVAFDKRQVVEAEIADINSLQAWKNLPFGFAGILKQMIKVPNFADLMMQEYSASTEEDQITKAISMMGGFSSYFDYIAATMCFIPEFILKGTIADWKKLAELPSQIITQLNLPAQQPGETKTGLTLMHRWLTRLEPVLLCMANSRAGKVDNKFWNDFYKYESTSGYGNDAISGNIIYFSPFLKNNPSKYSKEKTDELVLNHYILDDEVTLGKGESRGFDLTSGPKTSRMPGNFVSVDFLLRVHGVLYEMGMKAGMFAHTTSDEPKKVTSVVVGHSIFFKKNVPDTFKLRHDERADQPAISEIPKEYTAPPAHTANHSSEPVATAPAEGEITFKLVYRK